MLRRVSLVALLAAVIGIGLVAAPAWAESCPNPRPDGSCPGEWEDEDPDEPPGEDEDPGDDGGGTRVCIDPGWFTGDTPQVVPCVNDLGMVWIDSEHCYLGDPVDPPLPYSDPAWGGHTDGALYPCQGYEMPYSDIIWLPEPPVVVIDPGEAARRVIARMVFRPVDIEIAPRVDRNAMTVVGVPVWMWNGEPDDPQRWGPYEVTESESGLSVSVSAQVEKIVWTMGDGSTVTCTSPGTPYPASSRGTEASPDCGHRYDAGSAAQAGDAYTVTATSYWTIDWSAGGETGTEYLEVEDSEQLAVGELQVIVQ